MASVIHHKKVVWTIMFIDMRRDGPIQHILWLFVDIQPNERAVVVKFSFKEVYQSVDLLRVSQ